MLHCKWNEIQMQGIPSYLFILDVNNNGCLSSKSRSFYPRCTAPSTLMAEELYELVENSRNYPCRTLNMVSGPMRIGKTTLLADVVTNLMRTETAQILIHCLYHHKALEVKALIVGRSPFGITVDADDDFKLLYRESYIEITTNVHRLDDSLRTYVFIDELLVQPDTVSKLLGLGSATWVFTTLPYEYDWKAVNCTHMSAVRMLPDANHGWKLDTAMAGPMKVSEVDPSLLL
jgi:hypothetical protein